MLVISQNIRLAIAEVEITAIRSQGAGGQNVNKVSTAIHLRFNIHNSSLPDEYKKRLLALNDQRLTKEGVIVIKAQSSRSQDQNRQEALTKLIKLIQQANIKQKKRRATKPTKGSVKKRLEGKTNRKKLKQSRQKVMY
ncbi:MAG: alternative ribosome rescue aminoacyl-tRNA hydrolase ArfB [Colwellia sp.]